MAAAADARDVIHRVLVLASVVCCGFVFASFVLFADAQIAGASRHQQNELVSAVPVQGAASPKAKGEPRRFIDGAAGALTSPFSSLVPSNNPWVRHGVPTVLAMLIYGLGLGMAARYAQPGLPKL